MKWSKEVLAMKIFVGYHCDNCNTDYDVDSRNLIDHIEPDCPVCECNDEVNHIYIDDEEV